MEPTAAEAFVPRILVGTDFSPTAAVAVDWAVELARQQGAHVELIHAVTVPPAVPEYVSPSAIAPGPLFDAEVRQAAEPVRGRGRGSTRRPCTRR